MFESIRGASSFSLDAQNSSLSTNHDIMYRPIRIIQDGREQLKSKKTIADAYADQLG
jgi:hypothetical protein